MPIFVPTATFCLRLALCTADAIRPPHAPTPVPMSATRGSWFLPPTASMRERAAPAPVPISAPTRTGCRPAHLAACLFCESGAGSWVNRAPARRTAARNASASAPRSTDSPTSAARATGLCWADAALPQATNNSAINTMAPGCKGRSLHRARRSPQTPYAHADPNQMKLQNIPCKQRHPSRNRHSAERVVLNSPRKSARRCAAIGKPMNCVVTFKVTGTRA